ncbi:MAG: sugar ABC transporter substrate-binding protein [Candidatus Methanomethylicia archaeon]
MSASWIAVQNSIFQKFEEEHPGVKINYVQLSWSNGETKLAMAVAGGVPPDLALTANVDFIKEGAVVPINDYIPKGYDYFPSSLETFEYDGKIYAWPQYMVRGGIIINTSIFKERGVPLPKDGIWTWNEFVKDAQQLTFVDPKTHTKIYGFVFCPESEGWGMTQIDGVMLLQLKDGKWIFGYNTPEGISSLKRLWDLVHVYKVTPPDVGGYGSDNDSWNVFTQGRAAMTVEWGWAIGSLRSYNASIANGQTKGASPIHFTVADYPIGKLGKPMSGIVGIGSWMVFKQPTQNLEKRKLVMELASELCGPEMQMSSAFPTEGVFPTLKSASNIYAKDPDMNILSRVDGMVIEQYPLANADKIESLWTHEFQMILLNQVSIEQGVKDVAKQIDSLLGNQ